MRKREFIVPVTIADERHIIVVAHSKSEAKEKASHGQYKSLGRSRKRGFLLVGEPQEKANPEGAHHA